MLKQQIMGEWREAHHSIDSWLNRLSKGTQRRYLLYAYEYFAEWLPQNGDGDLRDKTPEELLDLQDVTNGRSRFRQLQMIQRFVQQKKIRVKTKTFIYAALRSFYEHNHVPLPRDRSFTLHSEKEPVESLLTIEEFRKLVFSSNLTYQTVFMVMFTGGMGISEFLYFNTHSWPEIQPQLRKGEKILKVNLPGRKHNKNRKPFYTFIGSDAVESLRRYLRKRGIPKPREAIINGERDEPLGEDAIRKYFHRHAVKIGILKQHTPSCPKCEGETERIRSKAKTRKPKVYYVCQDCGAKTPASKFPNNTHGLRYRCSVHELRDLFRSEWELSGAKGVVAEFTMGHTIDSNNYNKIMKLHPEWAEEQYLQVMPFLNILSEDPRKVGMSTIKGLTRQLEAAQHEINRLKVSKDDELSELHTKLQGQIEAQEEQNKRITNDIEVLKASIRELLNAERIGSDFENLDRRIPENVEFMKKYKRLMEKG